MTAPALRRGGASSRDAGGREVPTAGAVLLATENREISRAAIDRAAELAGRSGAPVHVFAITRIWGTSLGFPNPGLYPSRREWDAQRRNAERAVARLKRRGVAADATVIGTRAGAKRIVAEARRRGCAAIVMGADPPRNRVLANFMWSQEPHRVRRRADVPVHLVVESGP